MSGHEYTIRVTQKQAATIMDALEYYTRIKLGQVDIVVSDAFAGLIREVDVDRQELQQRCDAVTRLLFPHFAPGESLGVGHKTHPEKDVAWSVMQVIRHRLAWDRLADEGKAAPEFHGVSYSEPMHYGSGPMATIKRDSEGATDAK